MGTSKSNSGPSKKSSLLPDWAIEDTNSQNANTSNDSEVLENNELANDQKPNLNNEPKIEWRSVRTAFTSYYKSSNDSSKLNTALSRYVKASGGGKKITSSIISGKSSGIQLGSFLNDISKNGFKEAFKRLGIENLTGQSIESVFAQIARTLSPNGNEADDPYARSAISEALSKIYEEFELSNKDISELDNLDSAKAVEIFELFIESYISERLTSEMGKTLENKDFSEKEVIEKEFEMKEYIKEAVKLDFKDINLDDLDLSSTENSKKISEIFETAYKIMELL